MNLVMSCIRFVHRLTLPCLGECALLCLIDLYNSLGLNPA